MITQNINLSMTPEVQILPEVFCSQYDNGIRQVVFNLYTDDTMTTPYSVDGLSAIVQGTKPDGNAYAQGATASGSSVKVTIGTQMAAVAGIVPSEIVLSNAVERIGSLNFLLMVEPAGILDDAVVSDSEIPGYVNLAVKEAAGIAEAWANGTREGEPVPPTDPAYQNNAKWWSEVSGGRTLESLMDVEVPTPPTDNALIQFDATSGKWKEMDTPLPIAIGGTGNAIGYIQTGQSAGVLPGDRATAEGIDTRATGRGSHAEGELTRAEGNQSHAEGYFTFASGSISHAEGLYTHADGAYSHAEGVYTRAIGKGAHAGGNGESASGSSGNGNIIAARTAEFVQGNANAVKHSTGSPLRVYGAVFGVDCQAERFTADAEINLSWRGNDYNSRGGLNGIITNTAKVTITLEPMGIYLLLCNAFTISSGALYGAAARMISPIPVETGTPNSINLAGTQTAPAAIAVAANNILTIQNGADTRATQFTLIRVM